MRETVVENERNQRNTRRENKIMVTYLLTNVSGRRAWTGGELGLELGDDELGDVLRLELGDGLGEEKSKKKRLVR
jgi:hypothetical protein